MTFDPNALTSMEVTIISAALDDQGEMIAQNLSENYWSSMVGVDDALTDEYERVRKELCGKVGASG